MQTLNKVMLIGHLGKDPEYITFENGKALAKCSLATSETYRNEVGELQTHT
jgi:single-strand DNA-binding protein